MSENYQIRLEALASELVTPARFGRVAVSELFTGAELLYEQAELDSFDEASQG